MRVFGYFLHEQKVTRVRAGKAREVTNNMAAIREKKSFSPTRPAMGESVPIGAMRWHRAIKAQGTGAEPPKEVWGHQPLYISFSRISMISPTAPSRQ